MIGLCETHLAKHPEAGIPPDIRGYNCFYNNCSSASAGTALYYNAKLPAEEIQLQCQDNIRHRFTAAKIGEMTVLETYAVVNSANEQQREEYFAGLINAIQQIKQKYPRLPFVLIGDLNGHIRGWFSEETNENGKLIEHVAKRYGLEIVSQREPTFCRPGKLFCLDYTLVDEKAKQALLETRTADKLHIGTDHFL